MPTYETDDGYEVTTYGALIDFYYSNDECLMDRKLDTCNGNTLTEYYAEDFSYSSSSYTCTNMNLDATKTGSVCTAGKTYKCDERACIIDKEGTSQTDYCQNGINYVFNPYYQDCTPADPVNCSEATISATKTGKVCTGGTVGYCYISECKTRNGYSGTDYCNENVAYAYGIVGGDCEATPTDCSINDEYCSQGVCVKCTDDSHCGTNEVCNEDNSCECERGYDETPTLGCIKPDSACDNPNTILGDVFCWAWGGLNEKYNFL